MKIRELIINNFGKFTDRKLELSDGVNLIYGENESGKSTIHTFIKSMLFGLERGRGRASANDTFSRYEPWKNPNYYAGTLRFEIGGKIFRIDRNFDKYSKKASLICENDGEELSVQDGDISMLLDGLDALRYENTTAVGQMKVETNQSLAAELENYAMNYYATGNSDIDMESTLNVLREKKRQTERQLKEALHDRQRQREKIEQEAAYVWRDVHKLEEEKKRIEDELAYRKRKEQEDNVDIQGNKNVFDEIRPAKWRIHPLEIILFLAAVILAFMLVNKPWNYLVAIILFLLSGIYVWNRLKAGKKQVKTEPEIMLEEITWQEEKISLEKLEWERERTMQELREKQVLYGNLREQLEELDVVGSECKESDTRMAAVQMAVDRLRELSLLLQEEMKEELNAKVSDVIGQITGGRYTRLVIEERLHMSLMSDGRKIPMEQVSRGTLEQIYLSLRMASGEVLHGETHPVVLDDTFAYYDEERLKNTLAWLAGQSRQIILFTCQKREEQALLELRIPYHKIVL